MENQKVLTRPKAFKILHWAIFLLLLVLVATSVFNITFYSKEALIKSLEISMRMMNYEIPPADLLFAARVARREVWEFHFWTGVVFFTMLIPLFLYSRKKEFAWLMLGISTIFFSTGIILYVRAYIDITQSIQDMARSIHFYSFVVFMFLVAFHIYSSIRKENRDKLFVFSNMFRFSLALLFFQPLLYSEDNFYKEGVLYLKGEKGAIVKKIKLPNCPYERCRKPKDATAHIDETNGDKVFVFKNPNYKKAFYYLKKSAFGNGNTKAGEVLLSFLLKRVDYKSKNPSRYLVKRLKKELGISFLEYKETIKKLLDLLSNKSSCLGAYTIAEFTEKGYLGYEKNRKLALKYYNLVTRICSKDSYFYLASKNKGKL